MIAHPVNDENLVVEHSWGMPLTGIRLTVSIEELLAMNPELKIEQNANGEIVFMSPTGGESGRRNAEIPLSFISGQNALVA